MTGDQADQTARLKRVLAPWFGNGSTPILDAFLQAPAWALAFVYSLYAYAKLQVRIATATDGFLDLIAFDYFGPAIGRKAGQTDGSFRAVIQASILRERNTRKALIKVLQDVTGRTPILLEPSVVSDMGAWDSPYGYWDTQGAWGASLPYQMFLIAFRPVGGSKWAATTDADIFTAIESVRPAGTAVWAQLQN